MIQDMKTTLTRLFTVMMLIMVSMGAKAEVKVLFGEKGTELQPDKGGTITLAQKELTGGTVIISQEDQKDGTTKVTFAVTPDKNYKLAENGLEVYAVIPTDISSTRGLEVSTTLTLKSEDFKDEASKRTYTTTIDSKLNLWVKKAEFLPQKRDDAKSTTPPSGIWYIANDNSSTNHPGKVWSEASDDAKYYLVPAANPQQGSAIDAYYSPNHSSTNGDPEKPFLATAQTNKDLNSIWIVTKSGDYYFIIHALTGKYVIYEVPLPNDPNKNNDNDETKNGKRKTMHLQTIDNGDYNPLTNDNFKFEITESGNGYNIRPKNRTGWYWNPAGQNSNNYYGTSSSLYHQGLVGVYNNKGTNSIWHFEDASSAAELTPEISDVDVANNTFTITSPAAAFSTIRYTTDGTTTPNASTGTSAISGSYINITDNWNVQAVGVFGTLVTPVAGPKALQPASCATPVISFDYTTSMVSITCATEDATIYYTTNGDTPTAEATEYDDQPFSVTPPITIKAIATHTTLANSEVGKLEISQVATPTIQNNGSNAISITTATPGATIYYTTDGSTPTTDSTPYTIPLTENVSNVTIMAIAFKENMLPSEVGSGSVTLQCATPVITRVGMTFTLSCSMPTDATFYYSLDESTPATPYNGPVSFTIDQLPMTVTVVARHNDYTQSETSSMKLKTGSGSPEDPYLIYSSADFSNFVTNVNNGSTASACYKLGSDVSASGTDAIATEFTGTFDGDGYTISSLGHALFNSVNGGVVKNVILDNVDISSGTNVGAICNEAKGTTRIYNCGILSGSVGGSKKVGGLVGLLDGEARVINCFSYANITNGEDKGGIVGYNKVTSTQSSLTTMVMNCMFYGDIVDGNTIAPIYGGTEINNSADGMNNYNYYRYRSRYSKEKKITKYNRALAMEEKFITRFERYRLLLNSNKKLAAKYASVITSDPSTTITVNPDDMAKWVLETADRSITGRSPYPYPILKAQRYYPSIINYDAKNAPDSTTVGRNHGGKLGRTLSVTIATSKSDGGQTWPTGARITTTGLTLQRTDKDFDRFNYNYDKVQLPYYNDIGTGNYTGNRVVTGWKITSITGGNDGTYTESDSWGGYNFADRHCTKKDKYEINKRVFSQGAYWDVPEGVTAITIEPYWAIANYVSDGTYDVVYDKDYNKKDFTPFGSQYSNNSDIDIYGDNNNQKVYTSIANAIADFDNENKRVYDQAVVLVGNLHQYADPTKNDIPYTVMSIDMNHDNEPDYSYICSHDNRKPISPIRFDFLNVMGIAEAQLPKLTGSNDRFRNVSIFNLKGWFEITNTCVVNFSQFEYDNSNGAKNAVVKSEAPLILLGGTYEQFVSTQMGTLDYTTPKTKYIHIGGNAWFAKFGNGTHSDGKYFTPHVPISVTGGDYDEFYLSGTYQPNIENMQSDKAECYVSGGRFGDMAGASLEAIQGDVRWQIDWADITNFYGGGVNANNPITGDIRVDMTRSHVGQYCGGPKFGDMSVDKTVTTNATDCEFGTFFGAGYGGNSYNRVKYRDVENGVPNSYQGLYTTDRGKYFDGSSTNAYDTKPAYGKKGKGVATDFDYEFFIWSSGVTGARFYVQFVSFSLARTNNVTSSLTNCTINENFYGGGSLGKVNGTATSTLDRCTVKGNVFGGGYSATLPKIAVRNTPAFVTGKVPSKNINIGMFEEGEIAGTDDYEWKHVDSMPANGDPGMESTSAGNFVYTDEDLTTLGQVGTVNLTITNTTVDESVYGGGEESTVEGSTFVEFNSGTVGSEGKGGAQYGNVYGGGMGKYKDEDDNELAGDEAVKLGLVKGNTNVTIKGGSILHNVYGGGAFGSVGTYNYDGSGNITGHTDNTGKAEITITGGTIGTTGKDNGMIFGSSRGDVDEPGSIQDRLAWVHDTHVIIGTSGSGTVTTTPLIMGSVYGSGENGHTYQDAIVDVYSGTIGITSGVEVEDDNGNKYQGAAYPNRGNVYGGGCGTDTYNVTVTEGEGESAVTKTIKKFNPLAGIVQGTTTVNIDGGLVVRNVYGAGAMGSVGTASVATSGKTTVTVSGGRIGYDGNSNNDGNIFGAARGDLAATGDNLAQVRETEVNINYATTPTADNEDKNVQLIAGSVFGGGEAGKVKGSVAVNMTGGLVLKDVYGGGALADTQTSNWNPTGGTNNTGDWAEGKTSASTTTTIRLTGGTILGEAYGGGLGEAGKPAYVYGNVLLDLNGTTSSGEEGTPIANDARGCAVGEVFGCNNAAGTPMGQVMVHIYATQNKTKSQIANTAGETPVTDAKVKGSYDVKAVYGGGNLAAYEPAGGKNTTNSTNVIIDGCGLTSIQQVYGGGNAASTPATNVTVNGTFEIEEVFGGGNGKDDLPNGDPNPGANVGFRAYDVDATNAQTPEDRASNYGYGTGKASVNIFGGTIHRVFGGSNTKGNVRQTAVTMLEEVGGCDFCVDEAYGGGKSAPMDAEAKLLMACIPGLNAAYGGAEAADIQGNVTLTITNGRFERVFGGNNLSGTIRGAITVNVEEVGCKPIIIGELYGGGNQAGYSVYGYKEVTEGTNKVWKPRLPEDGLESGLSSVFNAPVVNVKSFTSIGAVYGGGYGETAVMVGDPTVNISVVEGAWKDYVGESSRYSETGYEYNATGYKGETLPISDGTTTHDVELPSHAKGKIGAIGKVFGGGNAASVKGNTNVNIGTLAKVSVKGYEEKSVSVGASVEGLYTRSGEGTAASPYRYIAAAGTAVAETTYYEEKNIEKDVIGADIRGNVYGGGNNAEVTGNTNVFIGRDATTTTNSGSSTTNP
jgi:hypothetical protein